jgi:TolA-binding protein
LEGELQELSADKDPARAAELFKALTEAYERFAEQNPDSAISAEYLFRAGQYLEGSDSLLRALRLYEVLFERYPDRQLAADALFQQGFIYHNKLGDTTRARAIYEQFLDRYPDHELSSSARSELDYLGLSPEEIFRLSQERNSSSE